MDGAGSCQLSFIGNAGYVQFNIEPKPHVKLLIGITRDDRCGPSKTVRSSTNAASPVRHGSRLTRPAPAPRAKEHTLTQFPIKQQQFGATSVEIRNEIGNTIFKLPEGMPS